MTRRHLLGLLAGLLVAPLAVHRWTSLRRSRDLKRCLFVADGRGLIWEPPDEGKFAPNMARWSRGVSEARPSEPGGWGSSTHDDFIAF